LKVRRCKNDFEKLRELIKLEQFQQVVDPDLRIWLLEQKPTTLESAAKLADQYVTLRRNVRVPQHHPYPAKSNPKTFHQNKIFRKRMLIRRIIVIINITLNHETIMKLRNVRKYTRIRKFVVFIVITLDMLLVSAQSVRQIALVILLVTRHQMS